ncbi:MAG: 4Fe-4S dicluster domain-containing protein [Deltaproteobacteria bacterium]|nr:MAG: 4Fe-4S dicluster domain-containing protein [Deltaproteobacteria bacterium]
MPTDDPIYRQLQIQLDRYPIGYPATKSGVEIDILKYFFTPLQAKIALCLTLRSIPIAPIRKRLKNKFHIELSHDDLAAMLDDMFVKGVIRRSENAGSSSYGVAMLAIGMFEYQVDALTSELVEMMHRYFDEAFGAEFFRSSLPQLRTSPHLRAIVPEYLVDTYDNMRHFITHTKETLHVANCVCKQGEALMGMPCKQTDNYEVCLLIGSTSYAARNRARQISKEECLKILDMAEEKGMVLQPGNSKKPSCICICCGCCCGVLTTAKKQPRPARFFATNYYARINTASCTGCGACEKRCQMDAIIADGKTFRVDPDRCIGCGLCVTRCKPRAARLIKKDKATVPPMNTESLYLSILMERAGRKKMIVNMLKLLFGKPL